MESVDRLQLHDFQLHYAGQSINPDEVVQVTLTLEVSPSIEGITSFSFDIIITASG